MVHIKYLIPNVWHMFKSDGDNVPLHLTIKLSPSFHVAIFSSMLSGEFLCIWDPSQNTAHHSSYLFVCCVLKSQTLSPANLKTGRRGCELVKFWLFITGFYDVTLHDVQKKKKNNLEIWLVCECGVKVRRNREVCEWTEEQTVPVSWWLWQIVKWLLFRCFSSMMETLTCSKSTPHSVISCLVSKTCREIAIINL